MKTVFPVIILTAYLCTVIVVDGAYVRTTTASPPPTTTAKPTGSPQWLAKVKALLDAAEHVTCEEDCDNCKKGADGTFLACRDVCTGLKDAKGRTLRVEETSCSGKTCRCERPPGSS